jgi:hypothetical protein
VQFPRKAGLRSLHSSRKRQARLSGNHRRRPEQRGLLQGKSTIFYDDRICLGKYLLFCYFHLDFYNDRICVGEYLVLLIFKALLQLSFRAKR